MSLETASGNSRSGLKILLQGIFLLTLLLASLSDSSARQSLADLTRPVHVRWLFKTDNVTNLTPAADNGRAYMPLGNGSIVSVRLSDGGLVWRSDIGGALSASPAVEDRKSVV